MLPLYSFSYCFGKASPRCGRGFAAIDALHSGGKYGRIGAKRPDCRWRGARRAARRRRARRPSAAGSGFAGTPCGPYSPAFSQVTQGAEAAQGRVDIRKAGRLLRVGGEGRPQARRCEASPWRAKPARGRHRRPRPAAAQPTLRLCGAFPGANRPFHLL